jgi:hypothetical protein
LLGRISETFTFLQTLKLGLLIAMETDHEKQASGNRDDHHLERLGYVQEVKV